MKYLIVMKGSGLVWLQCEDGNYVNTDSIMAIEHNAESMTCRRIDLVFFADKKYSYVYAYVCTETRGDIRDKTQQRIKELVELINYEKNGGKLEENKIDLL